MANYKSLIDSAGTLVNIINLDVEQPFEVHPSATWVDGPVTDREDAAQHWGDFEYVDGVVREKEYSPLPYDAARRYEYPSETQQLDMLWHMMDQGVIPGKGSEWYNAIKAVKDAYPKPAD